MREEESLYCVDCLAEHADCWGRQKIVCNLRRWPVELSCGSVVLQGVPGIPGETGSMGPDGEPVRSLCVCVCVCVCV